MLEEDAWRMISANSTNRRISFLRRFLIRSLKGEEKEDRFGKKKWVSLGPLLDEEENHPLARVSFLSVGEDKRPSKNRKIAIRGIEKGEGMTAGMRGRILSEKGSHTAAQKGGVASRTGKEGRRVYEALFYKRKEARHGQKNDVVGEGRNG